MQELNTDITYQWPSGDLHASARRSSLSAVARRCSVSSPAARCGLSPGGGGHSARCSLSACRTWRSRLKEGWGLWRCWSETIRHLGPSTSRHSGWSSSSERWDCGSTCCQCWSTSGRACWVRRGDVAWATVTRCTWRRSCPSPVHTSTRCFQTTPFVARI